MHTDDKWFVVKDLDGFVESARKLVYNNFGDWDKNEDDIVDSMITKPVDEKEFNELLTQEESKVIIKGALKKQRNKTTKAIRYLICDSLFYEILNQLNDRMVSNIISSLVKKGLVESAYDSEIDDWVFWVNEKHIGE
jgi:hypothetical protein